MNNELVEKLQENHPILNFYPSVGDGWYHIIDAMLTCIEYEIRHVDTNRAWRIKNNQTENLPEILTISFNDIKEKFGTMRISYLGGNDRISGIVTMSEHLSGHTCEDCGNVGRSRGGHWIRTQCDECAIKQVLIKDY